MITKKDIIKIAEVLRRIRNEKVTEEFANFLQRNNPQFKRSRFIGYVNGTNGPNGGKVKEK